MRIGYLSTLDTSSFGPSTRMHQNVTCRHICDKTTVYEVEASIDGVARIGESRIELGWCRRCQPLTDWAITAACRPHPRSWWLQPTSEQLVVAKSICAQCDVQQRCLAIASPEDPAICGGMTQTERSRARQRT